MIPRALPFETPILLGMAKRGYTRDTIRGGASDWDVSRPFSSYLRMLGSLIAHPVRFFEVLPKIPDVRAPALFLAFSGLPAGILWLLFEGLYPALLGLLVPLPLSFTLAGLYYLASMGGRYGYLITWRTVAYPLGLYLPLSAMPVLRWARLCRGNRHSATRGLRHRGEIAPGANLLPGREGPPCRPRTRA